ncbi:hypothetical protein N9L19_01460 [bacterium]|nr:hypothetical protein [bacterium]
MEGARGSLEDQLKLWRLQQEYSQEEVDNILQDAWGPSPYDPCALALTDGDVLALTDEEDTVAPLLPSSSNKRQTAKGPRGRESCGWRRAAAPRNVRVHMQNLRVRATQSRPALRVVAIEK